LDDDLSRTVEHLSQAVQSIVSENYSPIRCSKKESLEDDDDLRNELAALCDSENLLHQELESFKASRDSEYSDQTPLPTVESTKNGDTNAISVIQENELGTITSRNEA